MTVRDRVAIMQPYFMPYAGYFRLLSSTDLFVIYDCVQFPRRGWVHRNKLPDSTGAPQWITLPLRKAPQDVLIKDLAFAPDASAQMQERLRAFPLRATNQDLRAEAIDWVLRMDRGVTDYLVDLLFFVARRLDLPWSVLRSSTLDVPQSFRGQERIIEITRRVGGRAYINSPGGTALYQAEAFAEQGIELSFLPPYPGPHASILSRLLDEDHKALARDIASSA